MVGPKDLARMLELGKKKAELEFRKNILEDDTETELKEVEADLQAVSERAGRAGVEIVVPHGDELGRLQQVISGFGAEKIRDSIKVRDGSPYHTLGERGRIVKRNFENRLEIAKLSLIIRKASGAERDAIAAAIRSGSVPQGLKVRSIDPGLRGVLARLMRRCGIDAESREDEIVPAEAEPHEVKIQLPNRTIWIPKDLKPKLEENQSRLKHVNALIQLRNAERQIKEFSDSEEGEFSSLQEEYLGLLKEQDDILRAYNDEERLSLAALAGSR